VLTYLAYLIPMVAFVSWPSGRPDAIPRRTAESSATRTAVEHSFLHEQEAGSRASA
jgi:hypothetical protein